MTYGNLFLYEGGADPVDTAGWQYYDCKLLQDIGQYPAGCKVSVIVVNIEDFTLDIYEMDNESGKPNARYQIEIVIGQPIPLEK